MADNKPYFASNGVYRSNDEILTVTGNKGDKGDVGEKGDTGDSAYDVWIAQGYEGTENDFLEWTKQGIDGVDGDRGARGMSAYEVAVIEGFVGTRIAWLASLMGAAGADGENYVNILTPLTTDGNITIDGTIDSIKSLEVTTANPVEISAANYSAGQPFILTVVNTGGAVVTFNSANFVNANNRENPSNVISSAASISLINGYYNNILGKVILA